MKDNIIKLIGIIIFCLFICFMVVNGENWLKKNQDVYHYISLSEIENIEDEDYYIVFTSSTCATCIKLKEDIAQVRDDYPDMLNKKIYAIDIENEICITDEFLDSFGVKGVPFIVHYVKGEAVDVLYENIKKDEIVNFFDIGKNSKVSIIYFYSPTCLSCSNVEKYLSEIDETYSLEIQKYSIADIENKSLLNEYCEVYQVNENDVGLVPIIFIRESYLFEEEKIKNNLEQVILEVERGETIIVEGKNINYSNEYSLFQSLDIIKICMAAFLNGLNPCSFSMLFLLCMLLECKRDILLKAGVCYALGKCVIFVILGCTFYELVFITNNTWFNEVLNGVFLLLIMIFIFLNLNDYIAIKNDELGNIRAQLPEFVRKFNFELIKGWTYKFLGSKFFLIIILIMGLIIGATEFLCSGQIFLSTIVTVIRIQEFNTVAIMYLFLYSIVYIIPTLFIVMCVSFGKKIFDVSNVYSKHILHIKMVYIILYSIVAVYLIFQIK